MSNYKWWLWLELSFRNQLQSKKLQEWVKGLRGISHIPSTHCSQHGMKHLSGEVKITHWGPAEGEWAALKKCPCLSLFGQNDSQSSQEKQVQPQKIEYFFQSAKSEFISTTGPGSNPRPLIPTVQFLFNKSVTQPRQTQCQTTQTKKC